MLGPLNVLDLRHFAAHDLRPLLEAEAREWDAELMWDYSGSAEMILRYADSRILPGYAVMEEGRVTAYSFFVYEGNKAIIGDCYAAPVARAAGGRLELQRRLLEHVIETLQQTPGITRVESQLLLQPSEVIAAPFIDEGFARYVRLFLSIETSNLASRGNSRKAPPLKAAAVKMRRWQESDFQAAALLITRSYAGHVDSIINDQYRTTSGSLRFLNNIVRFPGCGSFDAGASLVAVDSRNQEQMVGLLLCSRVRADVAHITQVCLLPEYRGQGLGRTMIEMCAAQVAFSKGKKLTLTVTAENRSAVDLYLMLGFSVERNFDAFAWER